MENNGCLKNVTTEQNIAVNYSINLPKNGVKMSLLRKFRIMKSTFITKKLIIKITHNY